MKEESRPPENAFKNLATLEYVKILIEDHGILTLSAPANLEDGGGYGSIFGYSFGSAHQEAATGPNALGTFLSGLMLALGVRELDAIQNQPVFLYSETELGLGSSSNFIGIQALKKDGGKYFDIRAWQKAIQKYHANKKDK